MLKDELEMGGCIVSDTTSERTYVRDILKRIEHKRNLATYQHNWQDHEQANACYADYKQSIRDGSLELIDDDA